MSNNITYYLGAGASAFSIPVVNSFYEKAIVPFGKLFEGKNGSNFLAGKTNPEWTERNNFIQLCRDFSTTLKFHPTVDTFAKKLFIKGNTAELIGLKKYLILLFTYLHWTQKLDDRYDKFIAAIIEPGDDEEPLLPGNLKMISWNYDLQFELSLVQFLNSKFDFILNFINYYDRKYSSDVFSLVRLNGIATRINSEGKLLDFTFKHKIGSVVNPNDILEELFEIYKLLSDESPKYKILHECFTYCWEPSEYSGHSLDKAIKIANNTEILVIIGYSFPYVNREFDLEIINSMSNLIKIYIQDPNANSSMIDNLKERFETFENAVDIIPITETNEFYLPNEL